MDVPERIAHFQVVRRLGQGGMGTVYLVQDPTTPRQLALKVILDTVADSQATQRFWREARLLARLQHPNVVRVHGVGQAAQGPYLLEDHVEGQTLDAALRAGPLDPAQAASIAHALADALVAVHAAGILHRDLKPQNVILRPDGTPVLLDFGLAREAGSDRLTKTGALLGSPRYLSPEQARGASPSTLGPPVDVWGLGVVLYELLTGHPPFEGNAVTLLYKIMKDEPVWPATLRPSVPPALDAICRRAMAKAPADRFPDAAALRDALGRVVRGEATAPEPRSRGPLVALAAATLVLCFAALAAALVTRAPSTTPVSIAAPTTTQVAPPAPAPPAPRADLWRFDPARPLTTEIDYREVSPRGWFELRTVADTEVARDADAFVLTFALRDMAIGFGFGDDLESRYDAADPSTDHPLSAVRHVVGRRFSCRVDARTGAVSAVAGLDAIREPVLAEGFDRFNELLAAQVRDAFEEVMSEPFLGRHAAAVLGLLVDAPSAPRWRTAEPSGATARFTLAPSALQLPKALTSFDAVFQLTGRAEVVDGQRLDGTLDARADATAWSTFRLRLAPPP